MTAPFDLLRKSELRVTDVTLESADLSVLARVVAEVLELSAEEVLVTDYLNHVLTFDVLRPTLYSHQLLGRGEALLDALRGQPGVHLSAQSRITADGMLGWIAADGPAVAAAISVAQQAAADMDARVARRVAVFSTGAEMVSGEVKDTNWQVLESGLEAAGFTCTQLGTLPDDEVLIAGSVRRAMESGFGVIVTTGGVGAEDKDCTVEAILRLAPRAATPYTCRFEAGHGRHVKDGVRIAVATLRGARIICLPGPNEEVRSCLDLLAEGLVTAQPDAVLAQALAEVLRTGLRDRMVEQRHVDMDPR